MKQAAAGTMSGCLVWIIAFGIIGMCMFSIAMPIGVITSTSDFAIKQTGAIICPDNTTYNIRTYATTTTSSNGSRQPATAYVLQCLDASGNVVKEDPVGYGFLWVGMVAVPALILTGVLAFVLAAPIGILITKLLNKLKSSKSKTNILS